MSDMSYMEKLLDGVEVEWKALGEVATITIGEFIHKDKQDSSAKYPVYNGGISNTGYYKKFNNSGDKTIVSARGANAGFVNRIYKPYWAGNSCYSIGIINSAELNWIYVYYYLKNSENRLIGEQQKGGIPAVSKKQMEVFKIPIPCPENPKKSLEIQAEIVRILDTFTELTARKKQYNYYRDQLLSFEEGEGVKQMSLGDIYDFQYGQGNTIPKTGGQYPVYGSNGIVGSHDEYNSEDSPVIGHIGAYAGIINWGKGKHFVTYNGVICRHKSKEVLPQYAYYLLLLQDFGSKSNSASQPFVSYHILKAPVVFVPSIEDQACIVTILDKFDALTNSITEGLPREIALRQKQYEYYRDLLFSFPKPDSEVAD